MHRCAAYKGWSKPVAAQHLAEKAETVRDDVRALFIKDVLPDLRERIQSTVPDEKQQEPGYWDSIEKDISDSIEEAAGNDFRVNLAHPAVSYTEEEIQAEAPKTENAVQAHPKIVRSCSRRTHSTPRGTRRIFKLLGQRIKYSLFMRNPKP